LQGDDDALMTDQVAQEDNTPAAAEEAPTTEVAAAAAAQVADAEQHMPEQEQAQAQEHEQLDATAEEEPLTTPAVAAEPAQPAQFSVAPSELCDLVEWVFLNERKKLPGTTAEAARAAAAQFRQVFSEQLQQHAASKAAGSEEAAPGEGQQEQAGAPQLTVLPYLVEQQKAALLDKRAK
jgi:hypothetical protein